MFTTFLGGFVALLERSGGFKGLVKCLPKSAQEDRRFGQLSAYLFGILIFFDDYMNCLVVGGSLRPITDGLGISREKLAFIVDATAAPIASLIPLSSWVGYEISLIQVSNQTFTYLLPLPNMKIVCERRKSYTVMLL